MFFSLVQQVAQQRAGYFYGTKSKFTWCVFLFLNY